MRHLFVAALTAVCACVVVACSTSNKVSEEELTGLWVQPIPGQSGVQGVALEKGGKARSINMATLQYDSWKCEEETLILNGTSVGNRTSGTFSDTLRIVKLTADSLQLMKGNFPINYIRSKEECGFSANPGEIVEGVISFGHEVRSFRPFGSDTDYWLIDKSGYLQERYKASGQPEWKADAKLEVKNMGKMSEGFGRDYESAYQVLRVISVEDKK